jgi:hypothetical protein
MDPNSRLVAMGAAGSADESLYVEDVFSTYLYTSNGSAQTITNGIDLAGEGGLVWLKGRSIAASNFLYDTINGGTSYLSSNTTGALANTGQTVVNYTSTGFSFPSGNVSGENSNGNTYASWTFRKAAKFFDVVTYTGTGANRTIAHDLGSVPGCIIVKRTDTTGNWQVYHRANTAAPETDYLVLNSTAATADSDTRWNDTLPTSTEFSLGTDTTVNANTGTYVAYLFAHDAGGFGDAGTDNVVSCGSYTGNGTVNNATTEQPGPDINLGWEPQWVLIKNTTSAGGWFLFDTMRGFNVNANGPQRQLQANSASAEGDLGPSFVYLKLTNTGFKITAGAGAFFNELNNNYIYIAIRRGPMKTPEDATKVFAVNTWSGNNTDGRTITTDTVTDLFFAKERIVGGAPVEWPFNDRLRGPLKDLYSHSTSAETSPATNTVEKFDSNVAVVIGKAINGGSPRTYAGYSLRRAPGFFDVVAYTGTASVQTISHNLGVAPELLIVKSRNGATAWEVYSSAIANTEYLRLNDILAKTSGTTRWNSTSPTSTVFTVGTSTTVNATSGTYIAYLFATCPGVSKVGSYTGTGTTKDIDCGFTNGARFVLIKRTDSTGDWYVWDTARGIVSGNDSYLLLNSTAAEVTNTDYIDPLSSGFQISSTAPAAINASGGSFIFLAVA